MRSTINIKKNLSKNNAKASIEEQIKEVNQLDGSYNITLQMLQSKNPSKIHYSYSEAANELNVNSEFIRRRAKHGKITALRLGDKPFIHLTEVARILTYGVE